MGVDRGTSDVTITDHPEHSDIEKRHVMNIAAQEGVKSVDAAWKVLTRTEFIIIYIGIFLIIFAYSLDINTYGALLPYITSDFKLHSKMGLLGAISGVIMAISKVPLAKAADVFGRAEAFAFAIFCYVLGLIIMCVVDSFGEYAAASVLYGLGQSGVYTLQQIVIADTTSLANRGVFSSLIDLPFIANIWIGPRLADHFKSMQIDDKSQWRWGLGMSIILIFVCSLPIILGLKWVEKRAIRAGLVEKKRRFQRFSLTGLPRSLWRGCKEFDVPGLLLLSAGIFLIVFPINYRTNYEKGWQAPEIITMLVFGGVSLILFGIQQRFFAPSFSPTPVFPARIMKDRTVIGGLLSGFLIFISYYIYNTFFASYLFVTRDLNTTESQYISNAWNVGSILSSILVGFAMKKTRSFKMWSFIGLALNLLGNGLMIRVRGPNNSVVELVATQVLVGLGQGIMTCATQVGVQAAVAHQDVGIVTAIYLTVTSIGFAIGAAVAGALWGDILPNQLSKALPDLPAANITLIAGDIAAAKPFLAALPPDAAARMTDAYVHTLRTLNIVSCVMLVPIFVSIFIMKNIKLTDEVSTEEAEAAALADAKRRGE